MTTPNPDLLTGRPSRPPGLWAPPLVLPSSQAVISSQEVGSHVAAGEIKQVVTGMERSALMSGTIEQNFRSILDLTTQAATATRSLASDQARTAMRAGRSPAAGPAQPASPANTAANTATATPTAPAAAPYQAAPTSTGRGAARPDTTPAGSEQPGPMTYQQGKSISELRSRGAARLNQTLSEHAPDTFSQVTDASGRTTWQDKHGNHVADVGEDGRAVGPRAGEVEQFTRAASRSGRIMGAVSSYGEGGGISGALSKLAPKVMGMAGAAVAGTEMLGKFAVSQRASNAYYQNISGGSNFSGFGERLKESAFSRLSAFGTLGAGDAARLYRDVAAISPNQDVRTGGTDFALSNYKRTGMATDTSVALIGNAVRNGVTDFGSLQDALDKVSASARGAGVNVGKVQEAFVNTYKLVQTNISAGGGTAAVAGGLQAAQASMGPGAASGIDTVAMGANPTSQMMQATALGMSPLDYINQTQAGGTAGTHLLGQGITAQLNRAATLVMTPAARRRARELVLALAPDGNPSQEQLRKVANQLATEKDATGAPMLNILQAQAALSAAAQQQIALGDVGATAVNVAVGGYQKALATSMPAGADQTTVATTTVGALGDKNAKKITPAKPGTKEFGQQTEDLATAINPQANPESPHYIRENTAITYDYSKEALTSGNRNPAFEKMLSNGKIASDLNTRQFQITKNGKQSWVSFDEAFKQDQADVLSGNINTRKDDKDKTGKMLSEFMDNAAAADTPAPNANGTIVIFAKPELERLLGANYYGGQTAAAAAAAGVPATGQPPTATLPSGTGR